MGRYTITEAVLCRYHSGESSPEETAAVNSWLEQEEEEVEFIHSPAQEQHIEKVLWTAIEASTTRRAAKSHQLTLSRRLLAMAAASVAVIISACLHFYTSSQQPSQTVRLDNLNGAAAKAAKVDGLTFTALPKGYISANIARSSGEVTFCDVMVIENSSLEDISLKFASSCTDNGKATKNFVCKSGITYVALKLNKISPNIVIVDQRYMEDYLPLSLAMKINENIKTI